MDTIILSKDTPDMKGEIKFIEFSKDQEHSGAEKNIMEELIFKKLINIKSKNKAILISSTDDDWHILYGAKLQKIDQVKND